MASQIIGRYQFPVSDVLVIQQRTGLAGFIWPGFDVILRSGIKMYFTRAEKAELDKAIETESQIAYVAGIIANAQAKRG